MPRCPNCNYALVLLEHRRKYKCAKCSGLFSQREIDDKEFREQNKKRREEAKKEAKREYKKQYALENQDKIREWMKNYYAKNREKILAKAREKTKQLSEEEKNKSRQAQANWRENNREHYNQQKKGILGKQSGTHFRKKKGKLSGAKD